jgi:threonine dehydrogenase-like Zn-dependent dehydrogenase
MTAMSTRTTRAYVLTGPGEGEVQEVAAPVAALGEVVVDVERVGVCGTDVEFFTGEMAYLHQGYASYPMRLGHEWAGTVASVGNGVDPAWAGRRVMGDTMLGDGVCRRCRKGHQHVCENRYELGVRGTVPAPWPSRWPYRPPRYTPCLTPSTPCSVRWWSQAATLFVRPRVRP